MLDWRLQRQIIIFSIYFLIVFIPVFFISYTLLKKTPNCFDGIENNGELGIDCSGPCALQCSGTYRDIKINFVRSLKVSENVYDIFALLENYNTDVYFPNVPYTLSFYSEEGKLLGTTTGSLVLYPQSKNAIFIPNIVTVQNPKTVDLELHSHVGMSFDGDIPKNISVESWQAQRGANNSLQLVAELKNPNNYEYRDLSVYALLYDDTKTVYAVSATKIASILGRQNLGIAFTWGDIPSPRNVEFVVVLDN